MKASERKDFAQLVSDVMAFYRRDVSTFALGVWWEACKPFDFEQVSKAFTAHTMDPEGCKFPPMPGDLVRVLHGTRTDRGLLAWAKVFDAMQRVGAYQSVAFDDPAIHLAIEDIGGWPTVCRTLIDELPFVQKRFTEAYRVSAANPAPHPSRLIGESEVANQSARMTEQQRLMVEARTVLVGDPTRAREVIATGGAARRHEMQLISAATAHLQIAGAA